MPLKRLRGRPNARQPRPKRKLTERWPRKRYVRSALSPRCGCPRRIYPCPCPYLATLPPPCACTWLLTCGHSPHIHALPETEGKIGGGASGEQTRSPLATEADLAGRGGGRRERADAASERNERVAAGRAWKSRNHVKFRWVFDYKT